MNRLVLFSRPPGLSPGVWRINLIPARDAARLIADAFASKTLTSLISFDTTLDVIYELSAVSLRRYDPKTEDERQRIEPQAGDVLLVVMPNRAGKSKPQRARLLAYDLDFYRIDIN